MLSGTCRFPHELDADSSFRGVGSGTPSLHLGTYYYQRVGNWGYREILELPGLNLRSEDYPTESMYSIMGSSGLALVILRSALGYLDFGFSNCRGGLGDA